MMIFLRVLAAWTVADVIFVALWIRHAYPMSAQEREYEDAEQCRDLDEWGARHA